MRSGHSQMHRADWALVVLFLATFEYAVQGQTGSKSHAASPACADTTQRLLAPFVGHWTVRVAYRRGEAAWDSSTGEAHIRSEMDGCLLREDLHGARFGAPYHYLALWGAHGMPPRPIQRTFAHSQHGILSLSEGNWNARADTLILEDSAYVRDTWVRQRVVLSRPGPAGFTREGWRSEDHGQTWIVTERARYAPRRVQR